MQGGAERHSHTQSMLNKACKLVKFMPVNLPRSRGGSDVVCSILALYQDCAM